MNIDSTKLEKFKNNNNHHTLFHQAGNHYLLTLYSYGKPVITITRSLSPHIVGVYENYNKSRTTSKYVNLFIQEAFHMDREGAKKLLNYYIKENDLCF